MNDVAAPAFTFVVGLVIGSLSTFALFNGRLRVVETKVDGVLSRLDRRERFTNHNAEKDDG